MRIIYGELTEDEKSTVNMKDLIEKVLSLYHEKLKSNNIELRVDLSEFDFNLDINKSNISQVLINIINNALDAIESKKAEETRWLEINSFKSRGEYIINIKDSGPGVCPSIKDKIFNPFFTTKSMRKGIGMNLSISRSIVNSIGGDLTLDQNCENTCFQIRLPA